MRCTDRAGLLALSVVLGGLGCGDDLRPAVDAAAPDAPELDAPDLDAPDLDAPDLDAPDLDAPELDAPDLDAPDLDAPDAGPAGPLHLRIVSANLTSGSQQAYEDPGIRILDGLDADVALVQELNRGASSPTELRAFVDQAFGPSFAYYREPGVQLPNGIVSRFPILAAGTWADPSVGNRGFAWARIDVPGARDLWAVSVHLLTSSATNRNTEATALVQYITANVPVADYLVVGGDLNTDTRSEPCLTTLSAVVPVVAPYPVDQSANENTNGPRSKPYDWVLPDADLGPFQTATVLGTSTHPTGLVFDTRIYMPLSDGAPALLGDSAATNMQHMAVVKDFTLPE